MASSRLKHKLEVNPDATSQYGNLSESFVEIGTALPSLASTKKDSNEFKPIWEQEVFDEQGRKRLHGAFTGGFSAGYFNTVGSKEGWTPSTFKSSRSKRSGAAQAPSSKSTNVLDAAKQYMDDEDLSELASSRQLETSSSYRAPPSTTSYDPLMGLFNPPPSSSTSTSTPTSGAQAALASLIEPSSSRVGAKLMRKMGWREGQGAGPRLTAQQRRKQARELGLRLDDDDEEDREEEEDDEVKKHYFAPLDRPLMLLNGVSSSNDRGRGLGYDRGAGGKNKGREMMKKAALGKANIEEDPYGADEEERIAELVEFAEGDTEEDEYRIQRSGKRSKDLEPARPSRPGAIDSFHDGTTLLPGFVLLHEPYTPPTSSQLPPNPPRDWRPDPPRAWAEEKAEATAAASARDGQGRQHQQLSADQRGSLLGENMPRPPPKSVFEYLSSKDKERLSSVSFSGNLPGSTLSGTSSNLTPLGRGRGTAPPLAEPDEELAIPSLDSSTAFAALKGFQPFSAASTSPDPTRQARYTLFLQYSARQLPESTGFPFGPRRFPSGKMQTIKELNRELNDYVAAAKVFKPVSGMLGNRFTSGTSANSTPIVEPGLYQPPPKPIGFVSSSDEVGQPKEEVLTPAQQAVKADHFGPLTRTTTIFRPVKLLCKRFGVPDPFAVKADGGEEQDDGVQVGGKWKEATMDGHFVGSVSNSNGSRVGDVLGKESMEELMRSANGGAVRSEDPVDHFAEAASTKVGPGGGGKKVIPTLETVGLGDDERQGEETLTYTKAPKDIFEAIFKDSDDEGEDDDDEDEDDIPLVTSKEVELNQPGQDAKEEDSEPTVELPPSARMTEATGPTLAETTQLLSSETVVDYKPTFAIPTKSTSSSKDDKKHRGDHKKKKKEKRKVATLSFDVEEDEGARAELEKSNKKVKQGKRKDEPKSEREEGKGKVDEDDGDEWEEAPSVVHPSIVAASTPSSAVPSKSLVKPRDTVSFEPVKRPRAADMF